MAKWLDEYRAERAAEKADFEKRNPQHKPTKMQVIIRGIIGAYLFYLTYEMWTDPSFKAEQGSGHTLVIIGGIAFILFGLFFLINSIIRFAKHDYFNPKTDGFADEEEETDDNIVEANADGSENTATAAKAEKESINTEDNSHAAKTLSELAKLTARTQVPEDEQ